jgi:hypothetical protein
VVMSELERTPSHSLSNRLEKSAYRQLHQQMIVISLKNLVHLPYVWERPSGLCEVHHLPFRL